MTAQLRVRIGQASACGAKAVNQDFYGAVVPGRALLRAKGIAVALADGISSSAVSRTAAEIAVGSFLNDYYCTSEAWSVKRSAGQVVSAANFWLHAQTRKSAYRYDRDKGYVCTFSGLVLKGNRAHVFHVGDARVWRWRAGQCERLTEDHRYWVSRDEHYLGRALGMSDHVEIDYCSVAMAPGDLFALVTDGVHEVLDPAVMHSLIKESKDDLDAAAHALTAAALDAGSVDNLTVQLVHVEATAEAAPGGFPSEFAALPSPPTLAPGAHCDGYEIVRELHVSSRSRVYLAQDAATGQRVALKTPGSDVQHDPALLECFRMEEWVARRIDNPHVVRALSRPGSQRYCYVVTEFVEGVSLAQWMRDHPHPEMETVRAIVEQIAKGLRAFHRQEMIHQDVRPENIRIDGQGTVKLIDFGSAEVAGVSELGGDTGAGRVLGSEQYAAPEYFLGETGSAQSDIFSLGVVTYQMLTGELPYGTRVPACRTRAAQRALKYETAVRWDNHIPAWLDGALQRAVHPDPSRRYLEISEFIHDLRHPRPEFLRRGRVPLAEKRPERFWQGVSLLLAGVIVALLLVIDRT